jgi:hypothetical protein
MKAIVFILVSIFLSSNAHADERLFNKLQPKMDNNPAKGLEYAKRLKSKKSKQPDPYYFLASHYFEQFAKETRANKKFSPLKRAASEESRLRKSSNEDAYLKLRRDQLINALALEVKAYRDTFLLTKDYDKSELMALRYKRLTGKTLPTFAQLDSVADVERKIAQLALQIPKLIDGLYNGMPVGD